jgi:hypothetical protein
MPFELCNHGAASNFNLVHNPSTKIANFSAVNIHNTANGRLVSVAKPAWADVAYEFMHEVGSTTQAGTIAESFAYGGARIDVALRTAQGEFHIWQDQGNEVVHRDARNW